MLTAPNTGKRGEKRIEGGDELDARQGVDSSAHLKLEEDTVLTAGTASRRGTRLSSIPIREHFESPRGLGEPPIVDDQGPERAGRGRFSSSSASMRDDVSRSRISARCARGAPLTRDRPRTRAPFRRAPSAQHHGAMRSDVDGPRFVAALQHRLDRRGERFRSDGAGEPLNPCEADAALSCRERLGPEHEEGPLFGLTVVHDALPRLRVPREDVDVSQSPRLLDPRAVQCPVAPAGRDIEPWRSCLGLGY